MRNPRVRLKVVPKKNPQDMAAPSKYYVQAVRSASVDLEWLARAISNQSTVREPDCLAVLSAFVHNMIEELNRGSIVRLGSLGSFQVSVHSMASDKADQVTLANVLRTSLNFRPSSRLKDALGSIKFTLSDEV